MEDPFVDAHPDTTTTPPSPANLMNSRLLKGLFSIVPPSLEDRTDIGARMRAYLPVGQTARATDLFPLSRRRRGLDAGIGMVPIRRSARPCRDEGAFPGATADALAGAGSVRDRLGRGGDHRAQG